MEKKRSSKDTLAKLLAHLDTKAEAGFARVTLLGRALSRSRENLHLAVSSGIVAIPLTEIESVTNRDDTDDRIVSVVVRNGDRIHYLRRANQYVIGTPGGYSPGSDVVPLRPIYPNGNQPTQGKTVCTTTYTYDVDGYGMCDDEYCRWVWTA